MSCTEEIKDDTVRPLFVLDQEDPKSEEFCFAYKKMNKNLSQGKKYQPEKNTNCDISFYSNVSKDILN